MPFLKIDMKSQPCFDILKDFFLIVHSNCAGRGYKHDSYNYILIGIFPSIKEIFDIPDAVWKQYVDISISMYVRVRVPQSLGSGCMLYSV